MAERKNGLGGMPAALALCVALAAAMPAAAQGSRVVSAASQEPETVRAGAPEDYAWIDRADALWDVIGDSPPDMAFTFEDVEPWAWQTRDGHIIIVEEAAEGIRSYYFEPRSDTPFLTVEPGASFAFEAGDLAMAYGADGTALSELEGSARLEQAMVLFERARRLKRAMRSGGGAPVDSGAWAESSLYLGGFLDLWQQGFLAQPAWRAQRDSQAAQRWRDGLGDERLRRRALSDDFRRWREGGFQGRPSGRWQRPDPTRPGHPPRQGVQPRPNRPDTGRPDRPRPPGMSRPGRPDGVPGVGPGVQAPAVPPVPTPRPERPERPGGAFGGRPRPQDTMRPPVGTMPQPGRPGRPGWNGTRPGGAGGTRPPAAAPGTSSATLPDIGRPARPWGAPRPGWGRPRPVPQPGAVPQPDTSPQQPSVPSGVRPPRGGGRSDWNRRPPITTPSPSAPSGVTAPPARPGPARPGNRPDRRPRATETSAPAAPPQRTITSPPAQASESPTRPIRTRPSGVRGVRQD